MGMSKKKAAVTKLVVAFLLIIGLLYSVFNGLTISNRLIIPRGFGQGAWYMSGA